MGVARANLDFDCQWRFGFNIDASQNGCVGYLLFWSGIGGLNLTKDVTVWNPYSTNGQTIVTGKTVQCVGLIESFKYEGDPEDPIRISCWVSNVSAANIKAKLSRPITNTKVQVAWYIIDFDDFDDAWYEAAYIDGGANATANIDTMNGELQIGIANKATPIAEDIDIRVVKFDFQIIPAAGSQTTLQFATGTTQKLVKSWGASS